MSGDWDIRIVPAENGFHVCLDRWGKDLPTVRYNAATIEEVVAWIAAKMKEVQE